LIFDKAGFVSIFTLRPSKWTSKGGNRDKISMYSWSGNTGNERHGTNVEH
jgi:hypothetical protein